ncbi:DUF4230 domain-containing protein [Elizabethkingia anophelis]|uniref:DUF4230 domain-containing protein n=1 Tax=Elizabethkingia anophelis TaxID=1117645 RepID=UPI000CE9A4A1|nr:DUF4230 domain-containing protein [Elizabethkingia anophelis]AVF48639.1 hypothetical protein AL491_11375 [Elizabethkingia anophelis]AVF52634.1 hypothetical protein AL492_13785 [Elizabethkingia anophelis]MBG0506287.1 DUF4230 domain-containing protein [Elizabethkingia anophelis]MCT3804958.1 DUF4230 domain-containing protein [Elizabethkingia anophelis]MCT3812473.1 DUF4230 domain-containing protein [Elizabethkingia anophelis]
MRRTPTYIGILIGILSTLLAVSVWRGCKEKKAEAINQDYYLITNQISKMNKMVVLEQNFSSFQTHKSAAFKFGGYDILPKEMVLYTTAKAQVTYDLKQMKIDVDTINKKLVITELPRAEIKIYPDVKIHFMDDYAMNRFDQKSINGIMESAKQNMVKSVDQKKLEQEGHQQLVHNLNDIFVLAKALNYKIEDKTGELKGIIL